MPSTTQTPATATLRVKILREGAAMPAYKTDGAAGMDLAALLDAPITIAPRQIAPVSTGLAIAIPEGHEAQVRPRSGLAFKQGVTVVNAPGTIDSDYRGELIVGLINLGDQPFTIETGMRIAQLVIAPVTRAAIVETDDLDETERGEGGFGSTGLS